MDYIIGENGRHNYWHTKLENIFFFLRVKKRIYEKCLKINILSQQRHCALHNSCQTMCVNVCYVIRNKILVGSGKKQNFNKDPQCKSCLLLAMSRCQNRAILQRGSIEKFYLFCRIQLKFCFWLLKKTLTHILNVSVQNNKE